ncbi:hypothetical protein [Leptospira biflexa]|jgi:nitrogen regulatory protein PII|uniref:hypothetical protein n=1 Tax=Leptospira biflexa TaxID=172 RepID=UPI0010823E3B|nr:hypothetical protein [Leptospira biflexa]TGM32257.1 hypothetical protein EHQ89_15200 [Leptospira biflexa]TGM33823.1 hypothetical protein EHQ80_16405 [Leptospira biflexa]TGM57415.1 hypothetical protein EHQ91_00725 [Leptospira biflexa]
MKRKNSRITAIVHRDLTDSVISTLKNHGIFYFHMEPGRYPVLSKRGLWFFDFYQNRSIIDTPVSIFEIICEENAENVLISLLRDAAELNVPGHGSVYSESIDLICDPPSGYVFTSKEKMKPIGFTGLTGIFCVLPRGSAEPIARLVLQNGIAVPTISFGTGTGLRDKLGLLRITIPKEKEILKLVVHSSDIEHVLDFMIEVGRLDLPGRGFIFEFPVGHGLLNTKVSLEGPKQAASMDQIISALDQLYGNMDWRKKSNQFRISTRHRNYFEGVNLVLNCKEEMMEFVTSAIRKVGVTSSTISLNRLSHTGIAESTFTPAREVANLLIPKKNLSEVIGVLSEIGFFDLSFEGIAYSMEIPRAFSYQSKKSKSK